MNAGRCSNIAAAAGFVLYHRAAAAGRGGERERGQRRWAIDPNALLLAFSRLVSTVGKIMNGPRRINDIFA